MVLAMNAEFTARARTNLWREQAYFATAMKKDLLANPNEKIFLNHRNFDTEKYFEQKLKASTPRIISNKRYSNTIAPVYIIVIINEQLCNQICYP